MGLKLVGVGLGARRHVTLEALEAIGEAEEVYVDTYTSIIERGLVELISDKCRGRVVEASREMLEDRVGEILEKAKQGNVCIAIPGDPMIATTHSAVKTEGERRGVGVEVIHGLSIHTAAISKSGLHVYKFGRVATIPKTDDVRVLKQVYYVLLDNLCRGLHTLLLLDTREGGVVVGEALRMLLRVEEEEGRGIIREDGLAIALTRLGFKDEKIIATSIGDLMNHQLPPPPHSLIIPGELHFTEKDFIMSYSLDKSVVEKYKPANYVKDRVERYVEKTRRIIEKLSGEGSVDRRFLEYVEAYVEDSSRFLSSGDYINSLLAIGYAEGLLDALRLVGMVEFTW